MTKRKMTQQQFLKETWSGHPSREFFNMLRREIVLLKRGQESIERGKIPPEHCNYLAWYLETKVKPLYLEVVAALCQLARKQKRIE